MRVNALLEDLQRRKVHMAIMVDEYGNTAGLATIEDLIEQIVGEIQDEYDTEDPSIQPIGDGEYVVDGRVSIDDINYLADLQLSSDSADRIGGLVYEQLGRVPRVGDELVLEHATVTVLSVKGVRPQKLRIVRRQPMEASSLQEGELDEGGIHDPA
jgi:CBS domain containing-hemolysin-like protein